MHRSRVLLLLAVVSTLLGAALTQGAQAQGSSSSDSRPAVEPTTTNAGQEDRDPAPGKGPATRTTIGDVRSAATAVTYEGEYVEIADDDDVWGGDEGKGVPDPPEPPEAGPSASGVVQLDGGRAVPVTFAGSDVPRVGSRARIDGVVDPAASGEPSTVWVTDWEQVGEPESKGPPEGPTHERILAIPTYTNDQSAGTETTASFEASLAQVGSYYADVSEGAEVLTGDVTPWLGVPIASSCDGLWMLSTLQDAAQQAALQAGFDPADYDYVTVFFRNPCAAAAWTSASGSLGIAYVGGDRATVFVSPDLPQSSTVWAHELGHNFGMWHANAEHCGYELWLDGDDKCPVVEYANPWSVMGNGLPSALHLDSPKLDQMGWLGGSVAPVTHDGIYSLRALAAGPLGPTEPSPPDAGRVLEIDRGASSAIRLELRAPVGLDAAGPGQNAAPGFGVLAYDGEELLDGTPNSQWSHAPDFLDAALRIGQWYSIGGIRVRVLKPGTSPLWARVQVAGFELVPHEVQDVQATWSSADATVAVRWDWTPYPAGLITGYLVESDTGLSMTVGPSSTSAHLPVTAAGCLHVSVTPLWSGAPVPAAWAPQEICVLDHLQAPTGMTVDEAWWGIPSVVKVTWDPAPPYLAGVHTGYSGGFPAFPAAYGFSPSARFVVVNPGVVGCTPFSLRALGPNGATGPAGSSAPICVSTALQPVHDVHAGSVNGSLIIGVQWKRSLAMPGVEPTGYLVETVPALDSVTVPNFSTAAFLISPAQPGCYRYRVTPIGVPTSPPSALSAEELCFVSQPQPLTNVHAHATYWHELNPVVVDADRVLYTSTAGISYAASVSDVNHWYFGNLPVTVAAPPGSACHQYKLRIVQNGVTLQTVIAPEVICP